MPRTVGVDPGDSLVKIVELDGSYRKPRLLAVHVEPVTSGMPKAGIVATATRDAIDAGMKGEVRLGHPCREAVLRTLELPFKGKEAIRKVVKSEVESEIHGYAVDDMVVDFLEVEGAATGGTRVLVAAVPKEGLRVQLEALEAAAVEALHVDLDTMALWRAADWAGAFADDADAGHTTAVVDLGARSVKVLLVKGGELVDMRALRLGEAAIADEIAMRHALPFADAQRAVDECTATGASCEVSVAHELPATVGGDEEEAPEAGGGPPARRVTVAADEVEAARAAFLQRLRRELVRYLTSSGCGDVGAVLTTGGGCRHPGVDEALTEAFGVEPQELDLLGRLSHDLDEDEVRELGPRLTTAIGLALAPLGGPAGLELRREDLAFTRGFERIKFPLTIALMVGLLALFVYGNHRAAVLNNLELQIGKTWEGENGKVDFFGMVNSVLAGRWWENPQNFLYEESRGRDYRYKDLVEDLREAPVHRRILLLRDKLKLVADQKQKESGIYEDIALESGYAVLVRFSEIMNRLEPQLGRYLLSRIELNMKAPNRSLKFTVAFRENFRDRFGVVQQAFEAEYERADSPFERPDQKIGRSWFTEEIFRDTEKTGVAGAYFVVTLNVKESFAPFGAGASAGG